jgi:hypothetical protein
MMKTSRNDENFDDPLGASPAAACPPPATRDIRMHSPLESATRMHFTLESATRMHFTSRLCHPHA